MRFKGWHSRGYLPHFDVGGVVQHIVLCTQHALPTDLFPRLVGLDPVQKYEQINDMLDTCQLGTVFNNPHCAAAVERELIHFDGERYNLLAWCVMPNHVHIVCCCLGTANLGQIVRSWKVHATISINRLLGKQGPVFARDYFDRFMRDGDQTARAIAYVQNNPVAAGLCLHACDWRYSSAWHRASGWLPITANLPLTIS